MSAGMQVKGALLSACRLIDKLQHYCLIRLSSYQILMKLTDVCTAIIKKRDAINAAFVHRFGLDLLRLLAFNMGHALTLNMPGLGSGNCNACLLHGLLFFGLRSSTGEAIYHGLSTLYGHVAGATVGMAALYLFPADHYRLVVFTVLATFVSAFMQNSSTNFFGLICIIFMSSVILGNWETPYEDVQMFDIYSDFYGTCAAVAANVLFHFVYPMPSSRYNLFMGLAERIRGASLRTTQYADHLMNLYGTTDRDYCGALPQDNDILSSCIGPKFTPYKDIFQMRSELNVTQREVDAACHVVQAVDSLFTAVESMALPFCHREAKHDQQVETKPSGSQSSKAAGGTAMRRMRRVGSSDDLQTVEDKLVRESATTRRPLSRLKWSEWRRANDRGPNEKPLETPRFKVLLECHTNMLLELAHKLQLACENAPLRRFPRIPVEDILTRAYDSVLSEDEADHSANDADGIELRHCTNVTVLSGGGLLDHTKIQSFYDSIAHQFWPLFADSKFNHMFSNDQDSGPALCGINGMQLLQETAMCIAPLRCWCSISALFYTLSSTFEEVEPSFWQSVRHYLLRFLRILAAPITAIFDVVLAQVKKVFKNPKKFWKKHFRTDMGDGLFLLKFGIGLLLINVPVVFIPGLDEVFNNHHGSWVVFSFMFCLDKTRESSFRNSLYRLLSTLAAGFFGLCAVFMLDYSRIAFDIFCTVGIGCIAGGVGTAYRQYMSTFLSAFIVCVSCPLVYGASPSYSNLLHRILSVLIGGTAAVFVSSFLWPISAYKRVRIEIAASVKRIAECLLRTEPYFVNSQTLLTGGSAINASPSSSSVGPEVPVSKIPESTSPQKATVSVQKWLREHLRNEISVHEPGADVSNSAQKSVNQVAEISDLLSESFSSLRRALGMIEMIDIVKNARAKAVMSRVENSYDKLDQVREMLFSTLLLHMSVSMSVQACYRPPVKKATFAHGFYDSLRLLEQNYISRCDSRGEYSDQSPGDFERIVKSELKHVIVLLHAWEVKVWPKPRRLSFLADTAACVACNHCLWIQRDVDSQVDKLTSCAWSCPNSSSSVRTPRNPSLTKSFADEIASIQQKFSRSEVCVNLHAKSLAWIF
jgi:hypothetical protein